MAVADLSAPRWLIAVLLFVGGCALYGTALVHEPINVDEAHWVVEAANVWHLTSSGRFDDPFWSGYHLTWGYPSPSVSKFLMGIGMAAAGQGDPRAVTPSFSLEQGRPLKTPDDALRAARLSSVVFGSLAVSALFLFVSRDLPPRVALSSAMLIATSPVWFSACRRAMTDIHGVALSLFVLPAIRVGTGDVPRTERVRDTTGRVDSRRCGCGTLGGLQVLGGRQRAGPRRPPRARGVALRQRWTPLLGWSPGCDGNGPALFRSSGARVRPHLSVPLAGSAETLA